MPISLTIVFGGKGHLCPVGMNLASVMEHEFTHAMTGVAMKILFHAMLLCLLLPLPASADFNEGSEAYKRGDYGAALQEWRPLAEGGNARAQKNMGVIYRQGRGVPQDFAEAMRWYRRAAERGNAKAQFSLAHMYYEAQGVRQNYAEAAKWYRRAAEQGIALAQFSLGLMYYQGPGVPQDYEDAYRGWAKRGARR